MWMRSRPLWPMPWRTPDECQRGWRTWRSLSTTKARMARLAFTKASLSRNWRLHGGKSRSNHTLPRHDLRSVSTPTLARHVRVTLLHEVGHHFGIGEARLRVAGPDHSAGCRPPSPAGGRRYRGCSHDGAAQGQSGGSHQGESPQPSSASRHSRRPRQRCHGRSTDADQIWVVPVPRASPEAVECSAHCLGLESGPWSPTSNGPTTKKRH